MFAFGQIDNCRDHRKPDGIVKPGWQMRVDPNAVELRSCASCFPLEGRGHQVTPVQMAAEDPAILARAEATGAVVITADKWFLTELFRYPIGHRRCYRQAGVVQVPGDWVMTRLRIANYLPVIEAVYLLRSGQSDRRVAIDLSQREIRIREP